MENSDNASAKTEETPKEDLTLTPETRKRIEESMKDMMEVGIWGYKGMTDKNERDIALRSEAQSEKLFGYLYADDPENAKRKWQEYSGKAADRGLISRAEHMQLNKNANSSIDDITSEQKHVASTVEKYLSDKDQRTRRKASDDYQTALGDTQTRRRQYMRAGQNSIMEKQQDVDGGDLLKCMFKGATRTLDDFSAGLKEGKKGRMIKALMNEIISGSVQAENKNYREAIVGGFDFAESMRNKTTGSDMAKAAMGFATKSWAQMAAKFAGATFKRAQTAAPEPVKQQLLLISPALSLPSPGTFRHGPPAPDQSLGF